MDKEILAAYGLKPERYFLKPLGTGLINHTWVVNNLFNEPAFVLQLINTSVFKNPQAIADNIRRIEKYLTKNFSGYLFVAPLQTKAKAEMLFINGEGYYRLTSYLWDSHTIDVVETPGQAFDAAQQFGRFTKLLSGFDEEELQATLPDFHNLSLRYQQFETSLVNGNKERMAQSANLISFLQQQQSIVQTYEAIKQNLSFKQRVTHHDTKISNVLFDKNNKAICVIDLDTVMPGYFISDVGDMMRTYLSPVSEEENDFSKIEIREDYFEAIVKGYLSEMGEELTAEEKNHFVYAGKFLIYMQALRFLTDYLNNDIYYGANYEGHNFIRANNQAVLLKKIIEKEDILNSLIP
jgi:Phosphotransferase enzyme family